MGQLTLNAKVWYPSTTDTAEINVLMATLASSIENGLQPRLALQEVAVGLKAGLATPMSLVNTAATVPFVVNGNNGNFAQGMTISSGIVTVGTPGMYLASMAVSITTVAGDSVVPSLYKNGTLVASNEVSSSTTKYAVGAVSTVLNCVAGDTIYVKARNGASGATTSTAPASDLSYLSIAMVQALPA